MRKILLLGLFSVLFLVSCVNDTNSYNYCMTGCFAGLNYNGSEILKVDTDNISEEQLKGFVACEFFCEVAINEEII